MGTQLAQSLDIPFVDGDDLHPKSNIEKMSKGIALNDEDRLPWLLSIREKALSICNQKQQQQQQESSSDQPDKQTQSIRQLAEQYETSHQHTQDGILQEAEKARIALNEANQENESQKVQQGKQSYTSQHKHAACVIACSALKKSYRHLLRHGLSESESEAKLPADVDDHLHKDALDVYHVYLKVSPEELLRRMHERAGHFMKEDMLKSQLATLEDPTGEPRTIVLDDGPVQDLVKKGKDFFSSIL